MTDYLQQNLRIIRSDGRPTSEFIKLFNSLVDQLGGQGRDYVGETKTQSDGVVAGTVQGSFNDVVSGRVSTAIEAANANIQTAQETAAAVAGGSTSTLGGSITPTIATGITSKQVTFTATGGTTPYTTYAWVRVSGSTEITIDDDTIANPTFSTTSETEVTATWKCTVTDTAADTFPQTMGITLLGTGEGI